MSAGAVTNSYSEVLKVGSAITGPIPGSVCVTVLNNPNAVINYSAMRHITISYDLLQDRGRLSLFLSDPSAAARPIGTEI